MKEKRIREGLTGLKRHFKAFKNIGISGRKKCLKTVGLSENSDREISKFPADFCNNPADFCVGDVGFSQEMLKKVKNRYAKKLKNIRDVLNSEKSLEM